MLHLNSDHASVDRAVDVVVRSDGLQVVLAALHRLSAHLLRAPALAPTTTRALCSMASDLLAVLRNIAYVSSQADYLLHRTATLSLVLSFLPLPDCFDLAVLAGEQLLSTRGPYGIPRLLDLHGVMPALLALDPTRLAAASRLLSLLVYEPERSNAEVPLSAASLVAHWEEERVQYARARAGAAPLQPLPLAAEDVEVHTPLHVRMTVTENQLVVSHATLLIPRLVALLSTLPPPPVREGLHLLTPRPLTPAANDALRRQMAAMPNGAATLQGLGAHPHAALDVLTDMQLSTLAATARVPPDVLMTALRSTPGVHVDLPPLEEGEAEDARLAAPMQEGGETAMAMTWPAAGTGAFVPLDPAAPLPLKEEEATDVRLVGGSPSSAPVPAADAPSEALGAGAEAAAGHLLRHVHASPSPPPPPPSLPPLALRDVARARMGDIGAFVSALAVLPESSRYTAGADMVLLAMARGRPGFVVSGVVNATVGEVGRGRGGAAEAWWASAEQLRRLSKLPPSEASTGAAGPTPEDGAWPGARFGPELAKLQAAAALGGVARPSVQEALTAEAWENARALFRVPFSEEAFAGPMLRVAALLASACATAPPGHEVRGEGGAEAKAIFSEADLLPEPRRGGVVTVALSQPPGGAASPALQTDPVALHDSGSDTSSDTGSEEGEEEGEEASDSLLESMLAMLPAHLQALLQHMPGVQRTALLRSMGAGRAPDMGPRPAPPSAPVPTPLAPDAAAAMQRELGRIVALAGGDRGHAHASLAVRRTDLLAWWRQHLRSAFADLPRPAEEDDAPRAWASRRRDRPVPPPSLVHVQARERLVGLRVQEAAIRGRHTDILCVLAGLAGGKLRRFVTEAMLAAGLPRVLWRQVADIDWEYKPPPAGWIPPRLHGPGCRCTVEATHRIQLLRVVSLTLDRADFRSMWETWLSKARGFTVWELTMLQGLEAAGAAWHPDELDAVPTHTEGGVAYMAPGAAGHVAAAAVRRATDVGGWEAAALAALRLPGSAASAVEAAEVAELCASRRAALANTVCSPAGAVLAETSALASQLETVVRRSELLARGAAWEWEAYLPMLRPGQEPEGASGIMDEQVAPVFGGHGLGVGAMQCLSTDPRLGSVACRPGLVQALRGEGLLAPHQQHHVPPFHPWPTLPLAHVAAAPPDAAAGSALSTPPYLAGAVATPQPGPFRVFPDAAPRVMGSALHETPPLALTHTGRAEVRRVQGLLGTAGALATVGVMDPADAGSMGVSGRALLLGTLCLPHPSDCGIDLEPHVQPSRQLAEEGEEEGEEAVGRRILYPAGLSAKSAMEGDACLGTMGRMLLALRGLPYRAPTRFWVSSIVQSAISHAPTAVRWWAARSGVLTRMLADLVLVFDRSVKRQLTARQTAAGPGLTAPGSADDGSTALGGDGCGGVTERHLMQSCLDIVGVVVKNNPLGLRLLDHLMPPPVTAALLRLSLERPVDSNVAIRNIMLTMYYVGAGHSMRLVAEAGLAPPPDLTHPARFMALPILHAQSTPIALPGGLDPSTVSPTTPLLPADAEAALISAQGPSNGLPRWTLVSRRRPGAAGRLELRDTDRLDWFGQPHVPLEVPPTVVDAPPVTAALPGVEAEPVGCGFSCTLHAHCVPLVYLLMGGIASAQEVTQENLCTLNSAILHFVLAHAQGRLPGLVAAVRAYAAAVEAEDLSPGALDAAAVERESGVAPDSPPMWLPTVRSLAAYLHQQGAEYGVPDVDSDDEEGTALLEASGAAAATTAAPGDHEDDEEEEEGEGGEPSAYQAAVSSSRHARAHSRPTPQPQRTGQPSKGTLGQFEGLLRFWLQHYKALDRDRPSLLVSTGFVYEAWVETVLLLLGQWTREAAPPTPLHHLSSAPLDMPTPPPLSAHRGLSWLHPAEFGATALAAEAYRAASALL